MYSQIASEAVALGLALEDGEEVASALTVFSSQEYFTYINVLNRTNSKVYEYRKSKMSDPILDGSLNVQQIGDEVFYKREVILDGEVIGNITIRISMVEHVRSLSAVRKVLAIL